MIQLVSSLKQYFVPFQVVDYREGIERGTSITEIEGISTVLKVSFWFDMAVSK